MITFIKSIFSKDSSTKKMEIYESRNNDLIDITILWLKNKFTELVTIFPVIFRLMSFYTNILRYMTRIYKIVLFFIRGNIEFPVSIGAVKLLPINRANPSSIIFFVGSLEPIILSKYIKLFVMSIMIVSYDKVSTWDINKSLLKFWI